MASLTRTFAKLSLTKSPNVPNILGSIRHGCVPPVKPRHGYGVSFRRIVHYPDEYTVKPLEVTNLAGRDPETGRVVCKGIGGGIKHKFHWIDWKRVGPTDDSPPQQERVIKIIEDGCRTANVALVAVGDRLKYILATENMKEGDILKTSCYIPRIPVRANEGDAYPLGALPLGTVICCVEKYPGVGGFLVHSAGTFATIVRKAPNNRVIIHTPSKKDFSLHESCMCTIGRIGNIEHSSTHIGSAQRNRELGNRPRSGWWQRKTGRHGRKIYNPSPLRLFDSKPIVNQEVVDLTCTRPFTKTIKTQFHQN